MKVVGSSDEILQVSSVELVEGTPEPYKSLLMEFPEILSDSLKGCDPNHPIEHEIVTTGPPVFSRPRNLDAEKLKAAKREFQDLMDAGIVERSNSPYASPLHMVRKKCGGWRPCGDFRRLNAQTVPDRYPLPRISNLSANVKGAKIFSKLDVLKAYHQIPMAANSKAKTAICTPFGSYQYRRMPFGLKNSGSSFQRLIDICISDLPFCFAYIDDILVFSRNEQEHLHHLQQVLKRLKQFGLYVNPAKCLFGKSTVEFLGYVIDEKGIKPMPSNVKIINDFPAPTDIASLRRYLGVVNHYRRFIKGCADILRPLTDALKLDKSVKNVSSSQPINNRLIFRWTAEMDRAFRKSKEKLVSPPILIHPDPNCRLSLATDASDYGTGAVLQQLVGKTWLPLEFWSQKFSATEKNIAHSTRSSRLYFRL